ncbi:MAG TPA: glucose 1-dehydrogenase [Thermoleophilaceae bacterium]|nr:glucose 1-dehydrogenase [Thermoleophilaceae bacterium]
MAERRRPLEGRRALVTGGNTGIGRATCLRLGADGAAVALNYLRDPDAADEVVRQIGESDSAAVALEGDVGDEASVERFFAGAEEALGGPVDVLVNNAGIEMPYLLVDMPLDDWEKVLRVNLTGTFLCSRELARRLPEDRDGVIVNVSSVHELIPWPEFSHYCASKGAVKLFAQTIARELAPRVRVVNVGPGAIVTPINEDWVDDPEARQRVLDEIPLDRLGQPEEIAGAVAWLASPDASYVTGTTVFVDGGMTTYPNFV